MPAAERLNAAGDRGLDVGRSRIIAALLDVARGGMIVANEAIRERDAARAELRDARAVVRILDDALHACDKTCPAEGRNA